MIVNREKFLDDHAVVYCNIVLDAFVVDLCEVFFAALVILHKSLPPKRTLTSSVSFSFTSSFSPANCSLALLLSSSVSSLSSTVAPSLTHWSSFVTKSSSTPSLSYTKMTFVRPSTKPSSTIVVFCVVFLDTLVVIFLNRFLVAFLAIFRLAFLGTVLFVFLADSLFVFPVVFHDIFFIFLRCLGRL
ncbi:hypothetical protein BD769DRAFT_1504335 [Suillus cothurnatus]|nr:hypothetical protein BD769DRAFT_1504335 [Suillus cothurnatus]